VSLSFLGQARPGANPGDKSARHYTKKQKRKRKVEHDTTSLPEIQETFDVAKQRQTLDTTGDTSEDESGGEEGRLSRDSLSRVRTGFFFFFFVCFTFIPLQVLRTPLSKP
jgi:hypothetical protein